MMYVLYVCMDGGGACVQSVVSRPSVCLSVCLAGLPERGEGADAGAGVPDRQ
jgi:hypothetical protein